MLIQVEFEQPLLSEVEFKQNNLASQQWVKKNERLHNLGDAFYVNRVFRLKVTGAEDPSLVITCGFDFFSEEILSCHLVASTSAMRINDFESTYRLSVKFTWETRPRMPTTLRSSLLSFRLLLPNRGETPCRRRKEPPVFRVAVAEKRQYSLPVFSLMLPHLPCSLPPSFPSHQYPVSLSLLKAIKTIKEAAF